MKSDDYEQYVDVYDLFSSPLLFPTLVEFVKYLYGLISYKKTIAKTVSICDIGTGTGMFIEVLCDSYKDVDFSLVEPSKPMLKVLKKRLKNKDNVNWDYAYTVENIDMFDSEIVQGKPQLKDLGVALSLNKTSRVA